jgi:LuxR family maltose regulon positive regulatory protein
MTRLDNGLHGKLTLVSTPAGFGKTTSVAEWVSIGAQEVAWISLDEGDNDPVQFLIHLVAAFQQIDGRIGRTVQPIMRSPQRPPLQNLITSLINDVTALGIPLVLVLDDYHHITSEEVHQAVQFLLEHQPPAMHLVISTREDPPLHLPVWRARGQMTEIRARDLRFIVDQAAAFLHQTMGLSVSIETVRALQARTEGWIAGLQLAALALQEEHRESETHLAAFSGNDRYVIDYLVAEVLEQQPTTTRDFLRQTAILDRLTASLCDAVRLADDETHGDSREKTAANHETAKRC